MTATNRETFRVTLYRPREVGVPVRRTERFHSVSDAARWCGARCALYNRMKWHGGGFTSWTVEAFIPAANEWFITRSGKVGS